MIAGLIFKNFRKGPSGYLYPMTLSSLWNEIFKTLEPAKKFLFMP
jgi:hypothetical protein